MTMTRKTGMLFRMFSLVYGDVWEKRIIGEPDRFALSVIWDRALKEFSEDLVNEASLEAVKFYPYPPNVHQFLEILKSISKKKKFNETMLLNESKSGSDSENESNKFLKNDPIFQKIREENKGKALGRALISEICKRVKLTKDTQGR